MTLTIASPSDNARSRGLLHIKENCSPLTYDNYAPAIDRFLAWTRDNTESSSSPVEVVSAYKSYLKSLGYTAATVNKHLSAIKTYFKALVNIGILRPEILTAIRTVDQVKARGSRYGVRLTDDQIRALLHAPDTTTLKGRRDKAILAVFVGCGLRRSEVLSLVWGQLILAEDGVWIIDGILGKHGVTRNVAMPLWVKRIIDEYSTPGKPNSFVFQSLSRGGNFRGSLSESGVMVIVKEYSKKIGVEFALHDLRRTYAHLARRTGGVEGMTHLRDQLGHSSITVTERYIGESRDYSKSALLSPDLDIN